MKAWTGFFELVIITIFIIAGIPLLMSLIYAMNHSKFNYLDDKTIFSFPNAYDDTFVDATTGMTYPSAMLPIHTDFGGTLALTLIQDDYCPDDGKRVIWSFANTDPNVLIDGDNHGLDTGSDPDIDGLEHYGWAELVIQDGWQGIKTDRFYTIRNRIATDGIQMKYVVGDAPMYIVYNYRNHAWMITAKKVNSFK